MSLRADSESAAEGSRSTSVERSRRRKIQSSQTEFRVKRRKKFHWKNVVVIVTSSCVICLSSHFFVCRFVSRRRVCQLTTTSLSDPVKRIKFDSFIPDVNVQNCKVNREIEPDLSQSGIETKYYRENKQQSRNRRDWVRLPPQWSAELTDRTCLRRNWEIDWLNNTAKKTTTTTSCLSHNGAALLNCAQSDRQPHVERNRRFDANDVKSTVWCI